MNTKQVKKLNQHLINVELHELEKLIPFVTETTKIFKELGTATIQDFELKVNKATKFNNPTMAASALGFETQYKRLLELENLIGGKLTQADLNANNQLTNNLISKVKEEHTVYFTPGELKVKNDLDKVIKIYNSLDHQYRQQIGFNLKNELAYTLFSDLR